MISYRQHATFTSKTMFLSKIWDKFTGFFFEIVETSKSKFKK